MSNHDEFDRYAALVLGKIYESFPQAVMLDIKEFDENPDQNMVQNFAYTVDFLTNENYIRHGDGDNEGYFFTEATLTMKGLRALNAVPEFFSDKVPWGKRFAQLAAGGAKEVGKEAVKTLFGQFISGQ